MTTCDMLKSHCVDVTRRHRTEGEPPSASLSLPRCRRQIPSQCEADLERALRDLRAKEGEKEILFENIQTLKGQVNEKDEELLRCRSTNAKNLAEVEGKLKRVVAESGEKVKNAEEKVDGMRQLHKVLHS